MGVTRWSVVGFALALVACSAEVIEDDDPETAEQAKKDIPRRYETWKEACEWLSDWERLKGNLGRQPCEGRSTGPGKGIDCVNEPVSPECAETLRRIYACNALGLEQAKTPLAEQHCGFGVGECSPENLAIIDGEPRTYLDTDTLHTEAGECLTARNKKYGYGDD